MACPPAAPSEPATGATPSRRVAFEVLRRTFEHDAWADRALRSAADRYELAGRDRAFAQRLAYGAVKRRGTSDHFAELLADRPVAKLDPPALAALRLGLYEVLFEPTGAEHAAVSEAVELAKGHTRRRRAASGLVNAVLRRAVREREDLLATLADESPERAAVAHSYPEWVARQFWRELGPDAARALMAAMNEPPAPALRVNTLRADAQELAARLKAAGEAVAPPDAADGLLAPREALIARGGWGPALVAAVERGELVPQSLASQAAVAVLDPRPRERILDLCAGPGIKSTAIAARIDDRGEIRSLELERARAAQIGELAARLGARSVRPEVADVAQADLGSGYDRVLVDPPCTDLGALASRPDARWRKTADQAARLADLQGTILSRAAHALRPGGTLVYSTCTISLPENEEVVVRALERGGVGADDLGAEHPGLASTHDSRFLQTRPDRDGTAGFFIARLRRGER